MKFMIASDLHGSAYYTRQLLDAFQREGADRLLLLGDILYHGPRNDLPRDYAPKQVITMLSEVKDNILCVRGNCDTEVDQMVLDFPILADYICLSLDGLTVYATHGHKFNTDNPLPLSYGEILLHGHTHIPTSVEFGNNNHYLNPGSVAIPKGGFAKSYMIYENKTFTVKDFDGNVILSKQF